MPRIRGTRVGEERSDCSLWPPYENERGYITINKVPSYCCPEVIVGKGHRMLVEEVDNTHRFSPANLKLKWSAFPAMP